MDQRQALRFAADTAVTIRVLGDEEMRHPAHVTNVAGRVAGITIAVPVPAGAAIAIEFPEILVLAEVIYCRRDSTSYLLGVELQQAVSGLEQLLRVFEEWGFESPERAHAARHNAT